MSATPAGESGRQTPCGHDITNRCPDCPAQPADFLTVERPDGTTWTRLDRLTDGRVMCPLCFDYCTRDQLSTDTDGQLTDVCRPCRATENAAP